VRGEGLVGLAGPKAKWAVTLARPKVKKKNF
jgi:hypothetical protein